MSNKYIIDDTEYNAEELSERAKQTIVSLQFADQRIKELTAVKVLLQRAKNSYVDSLKKEMISDKAGIIFADD